MKFDEDFERLDALMSSYEQEGEGAPLRLGEQAFSWESVIELCEKIVQHKADLRVAVWWIKALTVVGTVADVLDAFKTVTSWIQSETTDVHPLPEEGENHGEILALNLSWLGSEQFLGWLGKTRVHSDGDIRLNDLTATASKSPVAEELRSQLGHLLEVLRRLNDFLRNVESDQVYEMDRPIQYVTGLLTQKTEFSPLATEVNGVEKTPVSEICSREDVASMLGLLIQYFQKSEPGHPAPIFLERVQRMLGANFQEIMKELYVDAPQLVSRIERPQGN